MPARTSQVAIEVLRGPLGAHVTQVATEVLRVSTKGAKLTQVAVEVLRLNEGSRTTQVAVEVLRESQFGVRASQVAVEVLRGPLGARPTQVAVEVLRGDRQGARLSQVAVEVMRVQTYGARPTQVAVEVLREADAPAYVTQAVAEVLRRGDAASRITQFVAEVFRTGDATARLTQTVAEVLRTNAPIQGDTETAPRPWPFDPNGEFDIAETYGYLSEVLTARDGREQRRLLRDTPSGSLTFTNTLLSARELQYAASLLWGFMGQEIAVPRWQYQQRLPVAVTAGDVTLTLPTAGLPFYMDALAMLWSDPWTWELFYVLGFDATTVTARHALVNSWPAHSTRLVPVVTGYLPEREDPVRHALEAGDHEVSFEVSKFSPTGPPAQSAPQYLGFDVLDLVGNRPGPVTDDVQRLQRVLDTQTGERFVDTLHAAPTVGRPYHWPCFGWSEAETLRRWLDTRRGVTVPFWVPTHEPDLKLAADALQGASQITIERIEYTDQVWANSYARRHVAAYVPGEAVSYHYVSLAADPGDGTPEVLNLGTPLPVDWLVGNVKLSFLRFCRLEAPLVQTTWRGVSFCEAAVPHVEIPKECPGVA